jgi:hypothetical protein
VSTEIEIYAAAPLPERWNYALAMASAGGLVPPGLCTGGVPDAGKMFYTFETGSMLNIHPVAAIQGVNIIEGKPTLSPALMSAVIRRAGHLIRVSTDGQLADLSLSATAELVRKDDPDHPFTVTWTIEKARRAGLLQVVQGQISAKVGRNNSPGVWEKYTEAMLKARAISEVCREGGTDALMGIGYVPEELGAEVNEAGELIVASSNGDYTTARRPAPQADDYRPIALVDPPATGASPVVVTQEAQTDPDMVTLYALADIATVIDARQAYVHAQRNGHLDRPVEGKPLRQWLTDLVALIEEANQGVDPDTGEVYPDDGPAQEAG